MLSAAILLLSSLVFFGVSAESIDSAVDKSQQSVNNNPPPASAFRNGGNTSSSSSSVAYVQQPTPSSSASGGGSATGRESSWQHRPAPTHYANERFAFGEEGSGPHLLAQQGYSRAGGSRMAAMSRRAATIHTADTAGMVSGTTPSSSSNSNSNSNNSRQQQQVAVAAMMQVDARATSTAFLEDKRYHRLGGS